MTSAAGPIPGSPVGPTSVGQPIGIDPVHQNVIQTTCAYCGVGCGVTAGVKDRDGRLVTVAGDTSHPANGGRLCSKGTALNETLGLAGRLLRPRINGRDAFWGEALDTIAAKIASVRAEHGPDAIGFYVSGQLLTEDYYVANKLVKGFLGTANIDTNSRLCMASTVVAQQRAFGEDAVPGCYEDLELADLVVLVGSNTAWCHPVLFQRIKAAKAARGTKVVVIDPRRTATCEIADLHLALRPGSDAALFNGLLAHLADQGALDASYIALHTAGYGGALNAARADAGSIEALAQRCGLAVADLQAFFRMFARTPKTVTCWSQGVNQSSGGTDKVSAIINCHLATGRIGKPGATPLSFTGQPNAMGGREVGGLATQLAAHMLLEDPAARAQVARFWHSSELPAKRGLKAVELFDAVARGDVKFLWIIGTNPAASLPDADRVRAAIAGCEFVVVSDCVADNDTLRLAHIALPAQAWGEKDGTVTNSERRISRQRALVAGAGEAKPDWWALAQVARRLGFGAQFSYAGPEEIFREHAALSALGNDAGKPRRLFDIGGLSALSDDDYRALAPVQWPVRSGQRAGSSRLFADGRFMHADGRARFIAVARHAPAHATRDDAPLVLNTNRLRDQWHTMTRTGVVPRLVRHADEPVLDMHPRDGEALGISDGGFVTVDSAHGSALLRARISGDLRPGEVSAPMHWTRTVSPSSCVNALVNAAVDPQSGQPEFKHTPVRITPWVAAVEAVLLLRQPLAALPVAPATATPGKVAVPADYVVRILEDGCVRLRLAQAGRPESLSGWLRGQLVAALGGDLPGQWLMRDDVASGRVALAYFVDGLLVAFGAVQAGGAPTRIDWLGRLVAQGALSDTDRLWLLADMLPPGERECGRQVCACMKVGEQALRDAARGGCRTVDALIAKTGAGTRCGTCIPELGEFVTRVERTTEQALPAPL